MSVTSGFCTSIDFFDRGHRKNLFAEGWESRERWMRIRCEVGSVARLRASLTTRTKHGATDKEYPMKAPAKKPAAAVKAPAKAAAKAAPAKKAAAAPAKKAAAAPAKKAAAPAKKPAGKK
jgi:hypothetical protein